MIFNMTGGGSGSGATLVVSCPANVTVTVSKDDKSYTKNSGNLGSATFKGLATGEWTVTIEGNEQTATKNITITADYAITIAFFAAYINITYPANSTCVVQTSGGTTVASDTNTDSSAKTWTATVGATGTYTITATSTSDSSKTKNTTVSITADGQVESVELYYRLYLYKNGDKCTDVGGDWSFSKKYSDGASISYGADKVTISLKSVHQQYMGNCFWYKNIDITNYSKLCMLISYNSATAAALGLCVCSSASNNPVDPENHDAIKKIKGSSATVPFELDISAISGSKYVGFGSSMGGTDSGSVQINEAYLV